MTDTDQRLDTLERRVISVDQRLEKMEGLYQSLHSGITSILAFQAAHSERLTCMDHRFDTLEKIVIEVRDSLNGHGS